MSAHARAIALPAVLPAASLARDNGIILIRIRITVSPAIARGHGCRSVDEVRGLHLGQVIVLNHHCPVPRTRHIERTLDRRDATALFMLLRGWCVSLVPVSASI